jgi:hypothetical protein
VIGVPMVGVRMVRVRMVRVRVIGVPMVRVRMVGVPMVRVRVIGVPMVRVRVIGVRMVGVPMVGVRMVRVRLRAPWLADFRAVRDQRNGQCARRVCALRVRTLGAHTGRKSGCMFERLHREFYDRGAFPCGGALTV